MLRLLTVLGVCCFILSVDSKFNILHIIVDDLRPELPPYRSADFYPGVGDTIQAPHIKQLGSKSVVFERAYSQYPLCTPSRTSFLTGRRPTTSGVMQHAEYFRDRHPNYITLPQFFKNNGYVSLGTGKVFHPLGEEKSESFHKFDKITKNQRTASNDVDKPFMIVPDDTSGRELLPDEAIKKMAVDHLHDFKRGKYKQKNFYLAVGFMKPHLPWVAPSKFFDLYNLGDLHLPVNKEAPLNCPNVSWPPFLNPIIESYPDVSEIRKTISGHNNISVADGCAKEYRRAYFACISFIDSLVGEVLDELEALNLHKETAIIFQSDHGYNLGEHSSWGKETVFETTNHVPLMFHVPGVPSRHVKELVELVDIFPTVADIAGFQDIVPQCGESNEKALCHEGRSLVELITGQEVEDIKEVVFFCHLHDADVVGRVLGQTVLSGRGRLTQWVAQSSERKGNVIAEELYDHEADPKEMENIIDSKHEEELKEILRGYLQQ